MFIPAIRAIYSLRFSQSAIYATTGLSLTLLMTWLGAADYSHHAMAFYDFAIPTNFLY
tara:strand:- start:716 stop:889 length:174 start_codon:yes stop_codon:yes gene_type:complete